MAFPRDDGGRTGRTRAARSAQQIHFERAAIMYWSRQAGPSTSLAELIRSAVATAVRGVADPGVTLA
jgi:hypothetical protein